MAVRRADFGYKKDAMESTPATRPTGLVSVRKTLDGLFRPRLGVYLADLLASAAVGWTGFWLAAFSSVGSPVFWIAGVVAILAQYRALLFIHELTHLTKGALPGFPALWNLIIGFPMLVPSFTYVGVHTDHHKRTLYGTSRDPEYLPLACGPRWRVVLFVVETVGAPLAFFVRFVVLAPLALLIPPLHRWLERRASSLVINMAYERRPLTPAQRRHMMLAEVAMLAYWGAALVLIARGVLPMQTLFVWYGVTFGVACINQIRTLGAHRYTNAEGEMDVVGQLEDSVTVPGSWWTELWAPVGLRYHALHHYVPDLPYHSLGAAHRRLLQVLPEDAPYRRAIARSLPEVLATLWRRAGRTTGIRGARADG